MAVIKKIFLVIFSFLFLLFFPRPAQATAPIGWLDVANGDIIAGWARDDDYSGPIPVHIYVDDVLVHDQLANGYRPDVGNHAFHWDHSPFGAGNHKVFVFAIDVDANGYPDPNGTNFYLSGSPKYFNVGCAGLIPPEDEWCQHNPNYWVNRQKDTKLLGNRYIKIGINNSYGGMISQLYSENRTYNLIQEHGGAAIQLSIWGYDISKGHSGAWFGTDDECDPLQYSTQEACLQKNNSCREYGAAWGDHVSDCVNVGVCLDWGAGAPWNPLQAQAVNCGWDSSTNDVDYSASTTTGGWQIRLDNPYHFTKPTAYPNMSFGQKVELGDIYAKIDYTIDYNGPYTTGIHPQEVPCIYVAKGINHTYYYYNGDQPFSDPNSQVSSVILPAGNRFLAFPNYKNRRTEAPFDKVTEYWWGVCDVNEIRCVTVAIFSDLVEEAHIDKPQDMTSYLTPIGWFNWYPGMHREFTLYLFPYKYDKVINGKSVKERIFELAGQHTPSFSLSPGWNKIVWPNISGKKASDIPPECPIAVAKENFWLRPYVKTYGGLNFDFISGKTYYLRCSQETVWTPLSSL